MRVRTRERRVVNAFFVNEEGGTKTKRPGARVRRARKTTPRLFSKNPSEPKTTTPVMPVQTRYFARAESAIWMGGFR